MLTMTMGQMYAASALLPYFDTKAALNGNNIENFSNFVQPSGDFTIELKAKANQEIRLGYGGITYTPTSDCLLRLVQKDDIVYVFEGNLYMQSITPDYNITGDNLIANGSLETTETLLTTGKWQATDWYALTQDKQSAWGTGGNSVTVRENSSYRSDGEKSVILHYDNRYFGQKLAQGAIESNATYKLSCDYWTSSGNNGDAEYRILLGTEQAGNDILDQYVYTTTKGNYSKHSYEGILQVSEVATDKDVYFSFYRNSSNCDWLDNVKLVKLTANQMGLKGAEAAEYTTGAYAPFNITLPADTYISMTSKITNPNFDDNTMSNKAPKGWTYSGDVSNSKISTGEKGDGVIAANQNHWQLWYGNTPKGCKAYQTISNLPNGLYEVSATIVTDRNTIAASLYANDGTTPIVFGNNGVYKVRGIVTNGTLELGLKIDITGGNNNTIDFDDFNLVYIPTNVTLDENTDNNIEDGYAAQVMLNRTINADKWNTLVLPFDLSNEQVLSAFGSDTQVAKYTNSTEQTIEFNTTTEGIKANEPVLVKTSTANTSYTFSNVTLADAEPISTGVDYSFAGTYNNVYTLQEGEYILSNNYFWKNDATKNYKVKAFRAYLKANGAEAAAKGFNLVIDGQTTGMKLNTIIGEVETATYNLAGQRVAKGYKGIVVKNGKKFINK